MEYSVIVKEVHGYELTIYANSKKDALELAENKMQKDKDLPEANYIYTLDSEDWSIEET